MARTAFESVHEESIVGKLTTVDRMIFNGYLTGILPPGYFGMFLWRQGVRLKEFKGYVGKATARVKERAQQIAEEAGRPFIYLNRTTDKDGLAKSIASRDGIESGLICVLYELELRGSFDVRYNAGSGQLEVVRRPRKCLHYYFYLIDAEFGFMHVRIQSWFPFDIQIYINGREWLARQLDKRGVGYQRYENTFLAIDDMKVAERLCERFAHRRWPRALDAFARRVSPWLPTVRRFSGRGYYWVVDQCEIATDVMFSSRGRLEGLVPELFNHALESFAAEEVMRFLGRKLNGNFKGEIVTDQKRRPQGCRVRHRVKANWIKMYDKWSVLRIETTINKPRDFRILRTVKDERGRKKRRWMAMGKGVANLWRYIQLGTQANGRYLDALGSVHFKGEAIAELDRLCRSRARHGKRFARFNPVTAGDTELFRAVLDGRHLVNGFRNRDLRARLHPKSARSPEQTRRECARVSRLIAKLRGHGLVAKVHKSRLYRVTPRGYRLMSAAVHYRHASFPEGLTAAA